MPRISEDWSAALLWKRFWAALSIGSLRNSAECGSSEIVNIYSSNIYIGSFTVKAVPFPSLEVTEIEPPCASMIRLDRERPRPVPPCLYVLKGSKMDSKRSEGIPQPLSFTCMDRISFFRLTESRMLPLSEIASFAFLLSIGYHLFR